MAEQEHLAVAIVDDDPVFREIASGLLAARTPYVISEAGDASDLMALLSRKAIDCVVLDYDLGAENGFTIKKLMDDQLRSPPPIVMLTGDGRESTVIKALRMGIEDYVPKRDLRASDLVTAIERAVSVRRAEGSARAELERLRSRSGWDDVSGLPGRGKLDEALARVAGLPAATRSGYGVILADMLEFDAIVGQTGLASGDAALRAFGKKLKNAVRGADICGRYDGSRFLVVVDAKADLGVLRTICERLAADPSGYQFGAISFGLTACAGGALFPTDGEAAATPLAAAEATLLRAKGSGAAFELDVSHPGSAASGGTDVTSPVADRTGAIDRRREQRLRVFKRGQMLLGGLNASVDCTVRNLSTNGAGLRIETPFAVPETFDLLVVGSGAVRKVRVRWQNGSDLGVEYV